MPTFVWFATVGAVFALLAVDLVVTGRRPHAPSMREATTWVVFYVSLAVLFGIGLFVAAGGGPAGEFFAGWVTEYSLSVDNLFVFVIIMARFAVPREFQQTVLTVGIVLALLLRGIFIALGAAAIESFSWIFYFFGAFLVYTAVKLVSGHGEESEYEDNAVLKLVKKVVPTTTEYAGRRLTTTVDGRRVVTPMLVVMIAVGTTDLLFALDSIPAIFGLTKEPYLVFTANAFALMGLRQLYFLLGGLLDRLVYLSYGLAVVLAFIGVKLVLEALHTNQLSIINGGEHVSWAPEIPIWLSLTIIITVLTVTTVASLVSSSRTEREAADAADAALPEGAGETLAQDLEPLARTDQEPGGARRE
ncbi:MAG: TerC family protein [Actinomycetota bacterium]|nr:TerC family protein [Actinomycetota bacterium]